LERHRFLMLGDALHANSPYVGQVLDAGMDYLLNAKPGSHKTLFAHIGGLWRWGGIKTHSTKDGKGGRTPFRVCEWCVAQWPFEGQVQFHPLPKYRP
jgi:hypothetical protein